METLFPRLRSARGPPGQGEIAGGAVEGERVGAEGEAVAVCAAEAAGGGAGFCDSPGAAEMRCHCLQGVKAPVAPSASQCPL